jgi:hypothetical protein
MATRTKPVPHILSFCCTHVVDGTRPVLLVNRPDGDWCFLCGKGDHIGLSSYCTVGMSHLVDDDQSLREVLDLCNWEEAERVAPGSAWLRSWIPIDSEQ